MNTRNHLKSLFAEIPPDMKKIRAILSSRAFSRNELTELALDCIWNCAYEYNDARIQGQTVPNPEQMHSGYIVDEISLLLEFGLDPNDIAEDENIMQNAVWIDTPNVAAAVLKLLLAHGGNPSLNIPGDPLFEYIDFMVFYDDEPHQRPHVIQCWLLLMAYGGHYPDGKIYLSMLGENSIEIFKDFTRFSYEIEETPETTGTGNDRKIHIYNKETGEKVAVTRS